MAKNPRASFSKTLSTETLRPWTQCTHKTLAYWLLSSLHSQYPVSFDLDTTNTPTVKKGTFLGSASMLDSKTSINYINHDDIFEDVDHGVFSTLTFEQNSPKPIKRKNANKKVQKLVKLL